ncbi:MULTISPECIES: hypothetical protein [Deinococcus]|uniref:Metallo-beta-lactamase domain-containing protein n=1 Tax=Deinococcus rufus TaxID=2136097 RepID=A0ABV7Z827_9DEIO|nr:hypothetical protein [Deinococcus sp. AB2017081]WQE97144.1 hypothetical protein U2P90_18890 [Deinococcus sp. AB2017081]
MTKITFHPLGNADCARIDLDNGRKLLIDYADTHCTGSGDKYIDLPTALRADLQQAKRKHYDVVAFSHLDLDHCQGAGEFFFFQHSNARQASDRIVMTQMWVPAAVITESRNDLCDDAKLVQAEARYRLREGRDILVFSQPDCLDEWLRNQDIDPSTRDHLIVTAGTLVPGFTLARDNVEFFVHSPFASHLNDRGSTVVRNDDAIAFQATFQHSGRVTRVMFTADIAYEVLGNIVQVTELKGNTDRLKWDVFKLPHHSSWKSIGPEKGKDKTQPTPEIERLYGTYGERFGMIVSTSDPIPTVDTDQPPHRQAAAYYREKARDLHGEYIVTMEHPSLSTPTPLVVEISGTGHVVLRGSLTQTPYDSTAPRAG